MPDETRQPVTEDSMPEKSDMGFPISEKPAAENPAPVLSITVDDGKRRIPVLNTQGEEIGYFMFRPTDVGIVERYNRMASRFDEVTKPLENVSINADGTADNNDEQAAVALQEAKKRLFALCDEMFDGNMSEAFFGSMHPFSPVDGAFYCEIAIEAVGKFISAQLDTETVKINKRIRKYTAGYQSGQKRRVNN